tara:strand:+ start:2669 stop:2869 length:201 start_codon:yes stop_codon:yes gene_type:complete
MKQKERNKVNEYTRASMKGKEIHCPKCDYPIIVYNFAFSKLKCYHCKKDIDKYDFYLQSHYERKKL